MPHPDLRVIHHLILALCDRDGVGLTRAGGYGMECRIFVRPSETLADIKHLVYQLVLNELRLMDLPRVPHYATAYPDGDPGDSLLLFFRDGVASPP